MASTKVCVLWGIGILTTSFAFLHGAPQKEAVNSKCQTPSEWFPSDFHYPPSSRNRRSYSNAELNATVTSIEDDTEAKFYRPEGAQEHKWPNGVVKYRISTSADSALSHDNTVELFKAIKEFQSKTCIRFESVDNAPNFVSIERWISEQLRNCGKASVCLRTSGAQVAKFTDWCMKKETFVHELGHTLCLTHEQWRNDRDDFVDLQDCDLNLAKDESNKSFGIYDYASQMHYKCDCAYGGGLSKNEHWQLCGDDIPGNDGLSVMDADTLNDMYNCQGCYRHRWRPIGSLTDSDIRDMYSFGHVDSEGQKIYPCRAMHKGEVAVGMYTFKSNGCKIPSRFNNASQLVMDQAEVLTIPGGLSANAGENDEEALFQYHLVSALSESKEDIVRLAVKAGNGFSVDGENRFAKSYIAFSSLSLKQFEFEGDLEHQPDYAQAIDVIGSAWDWENGTKFQSVFTTGKGNILQVEDFKVLICK